MTNNNLLIAVIVVLLVAVGAMFYHQHVRKEVASIDLPGNRKIEVTKPVSD